MSRSNRDAGDPLAAAGEGVLSRAHEYVRKRRVVRTFREGDALVADVQGTADKPYRVRITLNANRPTEADCSCPFEGDWCKHALAAVIVWKKDPQKLLNRPTLGELAETLTKASLVRFLDRLAKENPAFDEAFRIMAAPADAVERMTGDDFDSHTRRLVHSLDHLRRSEAYWQVGGVVDKVLELIEKVEEPLSQRKAEPAMKALTEITTAYADEWTTLDDSDGRCTEPFFRLGDLWTRILLEEAREGRKASSAHVSLLEGWHRELRDYNVYEFGAALEAARHGWGSPLFAEEPGHTKVVSRLGEQYERAMVGDRLRAVVESIENSRA